MGGHDIYSSSKAACDIIAESYIKSFFLIQIVVFQLSDLGIVLVEEMDKDRIVKDCAESFVKNKKLIIRSPNATRPWQHVLDPLFGYLKLSKKNYNNKRFNGSWNFGPNTKNNLKVKHLVLIGKKYLILLQK